MVAELVVSSARSRTACAGSVVVLPDVHDGRLQPRIFGAELEPSETKLTRINDQAIRRTLAQAGSFIDAEAGPGPEVVLRDPRHEQRPLEQTQTEGQRT